MVLDMPFSFVASSFTEVNFHNISLLNLAVFLNYFSCLTLIILSLWTLS